MTLSAARNVDGKSTPGYAIASDSTGLQILEILSVDVNVCRMRTFRCCCCQKVAFLDTRNTGDSDASAIVRVPDTSRNRHSTDTQCIAATAEPQRRQMSKTPSGERRPR